MRVRAATPLPHLCAPRPEALTATTAHEHHFGLRRTRMTESPRRKSLLMKRSLFTGFAFFFPPCGISVHISRTFSKTMLQWRSKAFTRARIFLLFRQLISTCELSFTHFCSTDSGPTSKLSLSSGLSSAMMLLDQGCREWECLLQLRN